MKVYFDSSALIAAMVAEEIHHERAAEALSESNDGFTSNHALSEVFATLTGGRLNLQLSPSEAAQGSAASANPSMAPARLCAPSARPLAASVRPRSRALELERMPLELRELELELRWLELGWCPNAV